MLYVTVELYEMADKISYTGQYFDAVYEKDWLNKPLVKEIIRDIDNSEHIRDNIIESPIFGGISPRELSTGCKGLLLALNMPELLLCGERFGDNCFKWLSKIGELHDIRITMHHFLKSDDIPISAIVTNTGAKVSNSFELNTEILRVGNE